MPVPRESSSQNGGVEALREERPLGRAAIAMAAVRHGTSESRAGSFDHTMVRPPTDVMAITSLPYPGHG